MITIIQASVLVSLIVSAWKIATKPNTYFFIGDDNSREKLTPEQEKQFDLMEYDHESDRYIIKARG